MRLGYTIFYVPDPPAALEFYERAFGLSRSSLSPDNHYAELDTGETRLAFVAHELAETHLPSGYRRGEPSAPPFGFEIGLVTDDVVGAFRKAVGAGAASVAEPSEKPWGQTVGYVRDLNGFIVEICSPME